MTMTMTGIDHETTIKMTIEKKIIRGSEIGNRTRCRDYYGHGCDDRYIDNCRNTYKDSYRDKYRDDSFDSDRVGSRENMCT